MSKYSELTQVLDLFSLTFASFNHFKIVCEVFPKVFAISEIDFPDLNKLIAICKSLSFIKVLLLIYKDRKYFLNMQLTSGHMTNM